VSFLPQDPQKSSTIPEEEKKVSPNADKCFQCSKLLGPVNFKCKCENFFCTRHRYPEDHRCSFDHRSAGIRKISEDNPLVEAAKFNKIV
jgi:predicted nucleic acid binding AN1-type Zn finger protein